MSRDIKESDWKLFRELRVTALERFCERTLSELQQLSAEPDRSFHERYLAVFRRVADRDKELARAFDGFSRSRMTTQLMYMRVLGLIDDADLVKFSEEVQALVASAHR